MANQNKGFGNMPTTGVISYDIEDLEDMTLKQLACQVIARMDLDRPTRENDLKASHAKAQLDIKVAELLQKFDALELPTVVQAISETYEEVFAE